MRLCVVAGRNGTALGSLAASAADSTAARRGEAEPRSHSGMITVKSVSFRLLLAVSAGGSASPQSRLLGWRGCCCCRQSEPPVSAACSCSASDAGVKRRDSDDIRVRSSGQGLISTTRCSGARRRVLPSQVPGAAAADACGEEAPITATRGRSRLVQRCVQRGARVHGGRLRRAIDDDGGVVVLGGNVPNAHQTFGARTGLRVGVCICSNDGHYLLGNVPFRSMACNGIMVSQKKIRRSGAAGAKQRSFCFESRASYARANITNRLLQPNTLNRRRAPTALSRIKQQYKYVAESEKGKM